MMTAPAAAMASAARLTAPSRGVRRTITLTSTLGGLSRARCPVQGLCVGRVAGLAGSPALLSRALGRCRLHRLDTGDVVYQRRRFAATGLRWDLLVVNSSYDGR